jgi:hypothetical protein
MVHQSGAWNDSSTTASLACLDGWQLAATESEEALLSFVAGVQRRPSCEHFVSTVRKADASARSHGSLLVLASSGLYMLPFAMNLVASMTHSWGSADSVMSHQRGRRPGLEHAATDLVMIATDPEICGAMPSLRHCLEMRRWVDEPGAPATGYGTKTYVNASTFPHLLVAATLSLNVTLVYTDCDVVWLSNPIERLRDELLLAGRGGMHDPSLDFVMAMDVPNPSKEMWYNRTYRASACGHYLASNSAVDATDGGRGNSSVAASTGPLPQHLWFGVGFYAARPSAAALAWFARWAVASVHWQALTVEKTACAAAAVSGPSILVSSSREQSRDKSLSPRNNHIRGTAPALVFAFLDPASFVCGLAFAPRSNLRKGWHLNPATAHIAHFNWLPGQDLKVRLSMLLFLARQSPRRAS